jgi:hypothetical protein
MSPNVARENLGALLGLLSMDSGVDVRKRPSNVLMDIVRRH